MRIFNSLIVRKIWKGGPFRNIQFVANYQKNEEGSLWRQKKTHNAPENWKGDLSFLVRFRKGTKKFLATVGTWTPDRCIPPKPIKTCDKKLWVRYLVWQKKRKKPSHCNSRAHFSIKAPIKNEVLPEQFFVGASWSGTRLYYTISRPISF